MLLLTLGLAVFILIHLVPAVPDLRRGMIDRYGEVPYKLAFSAIAIVGLAIIVIGYGKLQVNPGKNPIIWDPPSWTRLIAAVLMYLAMVLLIAAYIPSKIRSAAKHPMLAAVKLWALAHLLTNGDLGSIVLFGGFLAWAVYDRISVKKRAALGPLGAAQPGSIANDGLVLLLGTALYAFVLLWGHSWLTGVPLLPVGN